MKQLILIFMALLVATACKQGAPREDEGTKELSKPESRQLIPEPDVTITLKVNASELFEIPDPSLEEVLNHCELSDNSNNTKAVREKLTEFTTLVKPNDWVEWLGENNSTTENKFSVKIYCIVNDNNKDQKHPSIGPKQRARFFETIALCEDKDRRVRGQVKNIIEKDRWNFYWIYFRIYPDSNNKDDYKDFRIDPRLKYE